MKIWKKTILLVVLGFLEVVFLSGLFASYLPRRSGDAETFWRYYNARTPENFDAWMKERRITLKQVRCTKFAGAALAVGNLLLMGWLVRKRSAPVTREASTSGIRL